MKTIFHTIVLVTLISFLATSCGPDEDKTTIKPKNYIILLDVSDRILMPEQLDKDFFLIETAFKSFEKHAQRNLILTSKDRFSIKIIPQKNSKLEAGNYEDLLHLYLDELEVKDKSNTLKALSKSIKKTLSSLKKEAVYSSKPSDYFGVDIWAYLHDNGMELSKVGYDNTVLVLTDGYFDFESQAHVIQNKNQFTSTRFLKDLKGTNWEQIAATKDYGLVPIKLDKATKWIVAGIAGKKADDILQTQKITYFWKKWLKKSGVIASHFILNGSKTEMNSILLEQLK